MSKISLKERINEKINTNIIHESAPKYMMLELTNACNHKCLFCAHRKSDRPIVNMDKDFAIRMLEEGYDMGIKEVGLFLVGESFIYPYLVDIIEKAKRIGYTYVYCTTNGVLASPNMLKAIIRAGVDSIKFSINATDSSKYKVVHGKDDFDEVINNLKWLYDYKQKNDISINVYVSSVLTKYNNDEKIIREFFSGICDELVIYNAINMMGMLPELEQYGVCDKNQSMDVMKVPCYMVFNRVHITAEGLLSACCTDYNNYLIYTDLKSCSLKEAWNSENAKKLRENHINKTIKGTICENCISGIWNDVEPINPEYVYEFDIKKDITSFKQRIGIL